MNGTVERVMREVCWALRATLAERGKPLEELIRVMPTVQWAFDKAWRPSIGTTPSKVRMGHKSQATFVDLVEVDSGG